MQSKFSHKYLLSLKFNYNMRALILCFFVLFNNSLQAQKILIKKTGEVFVDEKQIGKFEAAGDEEMPSFIFSNIEGDDLINLDIDEDKKSKYIATFIDLDDCSKTLSNNQNIRLALINDVVKYKLLKDNYLDEAAVKKYCKVSMPKSKEREEDGDEPKVKVVKEKKQKEVNEDEDFNKEETTTEPIAKEATTAKLKYKPEVNNTENAPITLKDGIIFKGNILVGKFTNLSGLINGKRGRTITIFDKAGKRVAKLRWSEDDDKAELLTAKDAQRSILGITEKELEKIEFELISEVVSLGHL